MNISIGPPPDDIPKPEGLGDLLARHERTKTGWALRIGFDISGAPILLFQDDICPPNPIQRLLTWLLTGQKWIRAAESGKIE